MTAGVTLQTVLVPGWPKLAWVLSMDRQGRATVRHGPAVETRPDWIFEGVWDGEFEQGDFDRSELVFGSGVRVRGGRVVCVGASTTLDRLWLLERGHCWWVGNSLPAALAASGASLDMTYARYRGDLESVVFGLHKYRRHLPLSEGTAEVVYFDNIWLEGGAAIRVEKPTTTSEWADFAEYRRFLSLSAARIGANARAPGRALPYEAIATISSGYDSTASAVIAREAGASRAYTIRRARSLIPRSDSGEPIARALGLDLQAYDPPGESTAGEEWFLAALGWSMDLNLAAFDYPQDHLTMLFTGFHGDKFWDFHEGYPNSEIIRGDASGLGFTEFRLVQGVANCAVPFWGVRHAAAMKSITRSVELAHWTLGTRYDRPVPRRIAEEAGVPREMFGQRKSATTMDEHVYWPVTGSLDRSFRSFLRSSGRPRPPIRRARLMNQLDLTVLLPIRDFTGLRWPRLWVQVPQGEMLFPWAVSQLAAQLAATLQDAAHAW